LKGIKWWPEGGEVMVKRQWNSKQKAMIVLQGLKGTPVAELCVQHQISQGQYTGGAGPVLEQHAPDL